MSIAFICLEYGLSSNMKTYAGGLGILAGDIMKSATDLNMDFYGIGLLYTKGYLKQGIDAHSNYQTEQTDEWDITKHLRLSDKQFSLKLRDRTIQTRVWIYDVKSEFGKVNQVYFLDTDFGDNHELDRSICHTLYSPDADIRLMQELLLGFGGVEIMKQFDLLEDTDKIHLNESNVAFIVPALHEIYGDSIKEKLVFTTHTPIKAGHKKYERHFLEERISDELMKKIDAISGPYPLNLTEFCLYWADFTNGVSRKHSLVTKEMYPGRHVEYVTNGVHHLSWTTSHTQNLFDRYLPEWRQNPFELHNVPEIEDEDIFATHRLNKLELIEFVKTRAGITLNEDMFTIGFARRADGYKRHDFLLYDIDLLKSIAEKFDGLQVIYAGKAYFGGGGQQSSIAHINHIAQQSLGDKLRIVFIPDYSMDVSLKMVSGCDVWLNNPQKPLEACGTSGMKAALNGVPNFSVLDGWWSEGWVENETGWNIGDDNRESTVQQMNEYDELATVYKKLEEVIMPKYYYDTKDWYRIMKHAVALNGSYFHGTRMMEEYSAKAYQS